MNDDYITTVDMALNWVSTSATQIRSNLASDWASDTGVFIGTNTNTAPGDWSDLLVKGKDFNGPNISLTGPYSYTYETYLTTNDEMKCEDDGDYVGIPKYKLKHR